MKYEVAITASKL